MHRYPIRLMSVLFLILLCGWWSIPVARAQNRPHTPGAKSLVIGTKSAPPFAIKHPDGTWSGISLDLWERIATELKLDYHLQELDLEGLVNGVQQGSLDAAVAALTMTAERET